MEINKPVATIILLIIALILIFLFIIPKYQESGDLQANLAQKQAEYDGQSDYYMKIFELLKSIRDRKDALGKINSALPSDISFASLIYFLQEKGVENGLAVKSIIFSQNSPETYRQVLPAESDKRVKNIMFNINLSGSYQSLKNFLSSLEKSVRLFQIDAISFISTQSLQGTKKSQNQLQIHDFNLEVKTYTY